MAFLFPKACESTSLHIASANAELAHNLAESCTYANEFFFFSMFLIQVLVLPTFCRQRVKHGCKATEVSVKS